MARGSLTGAVDFKALQRSPPWEWPADTGRRLLAILTDPHAPGSDRLLAAELGGDYTIVNDDLVLALLAIVEDASAPEELRGKAAISLGPALDDAGTTYFDDVSSYEEDDVLISRETFRRVRRSLRLLYGDGDVPPEVHRSILEASARAPEDWHEDAVRTAYSSAEPLWKVTAVFCMRFVPGFEEEILEALGSNALDIQYQAVCAAGSRGIDDAWPPLAELATAEDTLRHLRLAAIEGLGSVRPRDSVDVLLELIETADGEIADAAWEALGMAQALADDEDEEGGF